MIRSLLLLFMTTLTLLSATMLEDKEPDTPAKSLVVEMEDCDDWDRVFADSAFAAQRAIDTQLKITSREDIFHDVWQVGCNDAVVYLPTFSDECCDLSTKHDARLQTIDRVRDYTGGHYPRNAIGRSSGGGSVWSSALCF